MINLSTISTHHDCCFELIGADIMIDQTFKPWLLEMNMPPALGVDNDIDTKIKSRLIRDMVKLVHFEKYDEFYQKEQDERDAAKHQKRFLSRRAPKSEEGPKSSQF